MKRLNFRLHQDVKDVRFRAKQECFGLRQEVDRLQAMNTEPEKKFSDSLHLLDNYTCSLAEQLSQERSRSANLCSEMKAKQKMHDVCLAAATLQLRQLSAERDEERVVYPSDLHRHEEEWTLKVEDARECESSGRRALEES